MTKVIDSSAIPTAKSAKEVKLEKVELKNVLFDGGQEDLTVEVMPFDRYDEKHTEFAYAYSDMLCKIQSELTSVSEASRAYVCIFMVHTIEDKKNRTSSFNKVLGDLRACRSLFHQPEVLKSLNDFFENV